MKLQCGHNSSCDLDTICPECGRSFIATPFMPYAVGVIMVLFIYYSDKFIPGSYAEKLSILMVLFVWFLEVCILRKKGTELIANLLISIPVLIIAFQHIIPSGIGSNLKSTIIAFAYLVLSVPFIFAIFLGFKDAIHYDSLNKGSFWLIISLFISILISVLYGIFPVIQKLNPFEDIRETLATMYNYLEVIFNYRTAFVAIILGVVTVFSISGALRSELKVRGVKKSAIEDPNASAFDVIFVGLSRFFGNLGEAIVTGVDLGRQILAVVFIEVFKLFKDSLIRSLLIMIRVLRVVVLALIVLGIAIVIGKIVSYIETLWQSPTFFTMDITEWGIFFLFCLLFGFAIWIFTMFTYKKWRDYLNFPLGLKRTFISFFGTRDEALTAHRSITISVFMHVFFLSLVFLGAWLIINPTHLILNLDKPNPIGILFCITIMVMIILGSIRMIMKK
jgi:hypothetical protein